jgi:CysZ protein
MEPNLVGRGNIGRHIERGLELRGQHQSHLASSPPPLRRVRRTKPDHLMLGDAFDSFAQIFSPPFRGVMWKSLGLTAAILVLAGVGLDRLALSLIHVGPSWLGTVLSIIVALGLIAGIVLLAAPTVLFVASFFLDDIATIVEREIDPYAAPGRPAPLIASVAMGLRFAVLSILVNIVVLLLTLFTGVGFVSFFLLNGYLLGREYFELAAMRHLAPGDAVALRRRTSGQVYLAGVIISGVVAVPLLNLLTPLFATAFMVRLYKRVA